ncbi:MAG: SDR family oxidoreductase [Chloroflexi bacterium]|nr:SDR family oxidoreductase [Chloroflexota bacterium]
MKTVVITGSTRGIGRGLADAFLARGCAVVVSGRTPEAVEQAVAALSTTHDATRVFGQPCNVTDPAEVQALWDVALTHLGQIDIWINNAGISGAAPGFQDLEPGQIRQVVDTNLVGVMYGARVALRGMQAQGWGSIYNMEGLGSDGSLQRGTALYGTTKRGVRYLTRALAQEVAGTPVLVGALSPGMVVTDFLVGQTRSPEDWARVKRIFNILADRVETVTPWLAQQVLDNRRNGVTIAWLTRRKVIARFLTAPLRRRDLFDGLAPRANE